MSGGVLAPAGVAAAAQGAALGAAAGLAVGQAISPFFFSKSDGSAELLVQPLVFAVSSLTTKGSCSSADPTQMPSTTGAS
jgi:hypothetical protein